MRRDYRTFMCCLCGAVTEHVPPHGWNYPCPVKVREIEAQIAASEASKAAHEATLTSVYRIARAQEDMRDSVVPRDEEDEDA